MNHRSKEKKGNPKPVPPTSSGKEDDALAQQYGGKHTGGWVGHLPASWIPYIQLARLSPPAGVFLVFFPHFFGVVHGALLQGSPWEHTLQVVGLLGLGSFFVSNAIHGWNDLIDADLDALVARTCQRPIVRGAVSPRGALIFTVSQLLGAMALLLVLPVGTSVAALPSVVINFYYPWSKRHTHFAQLVLGFSLAWGVFVGTAAMGIEPWAGHDSDALVPTVCLFIASSLWTVIYDTIYAFQDIVDDEKVGIKSTAILFRSWTKPFLFVLLACIVALLTAYGELLLSNNNTDAGSYFYYVYYLVTVGGCVTSLGAMVAMVNLSDPFSCWWWFRYGFWLAGGSISAGLLLQYVVGTASGY
ncbi:UbiA prenyltransferase family domain containing protein [Naviculisporaceae sp. PSN 640]